MSQLRLYDGFYNTELQRVRSLHLFHTLVSTVSISADPQVSEGLAEWEECSLYAVTAWDDLRHAHASWKQPQPVQGGTGPK